MTAASQESPKYNVMLVGTRANIEAGQVRRALAALFKVQTEAIDGLLTKMPCVIKAKVSADVAQKYKIAIESAGGRCEIRPDAEDPMSFDLPPTNERQHSPSEPQRNTEEAVVGTTHGNATANAVSGDDRDSGWHYERDGQRIGPRWRGELERLIGQRAIGPDTLVWHQQGEWVRADRSELAPVFRSLQATPPPLPTEKVDSKVVWLVAAIPVLGVVIEQLLTGHVQKIPTIMIICGYVLVYSILLVVDEHRLKHAGHKAPEFMWVFLVPVYLWRRASHLNHKPSYFWAWVIALIAAMFINPASNPFAKALVKVNCLGVDFDTVQCQFSNEGSAPGTMCVDVVLVCNDGRRRSPVCSASIAPGGSDAKVAKNWSSPMTLLSQCSGVEYENMKVTVP